MRRRKPIPCIETLERDPPDPLVWLAQFASADRRGDEPTARELLRQLLCLGYWVGAAEGIPLATLSVQGGSNYRLVQVSGEEAARLREENGRGTVPPHSTPK